MPLALYEIANKYKMPALFFDKANSYAPTWDGSVVNVPFKETLTDGEGVGWLYHEIAHYLFAPKNSRKLPNFGLGTDPGGGGKSEVDHLAYRGVNADDDEGAVCILNLFLMIEDGVDKNLIDVHAENYSIFEFSNYDLHLLQKAGFDPERIRASVEPYLDFRHVAWHSNNTERY